MIPPHVRYLLAFFLINALSDFLTREVILSIVWLEIGGKYNKVSKLKKGVSISRRLTMSYLKEHVITHKKEFSVWYRFKTVFDAAAALLTVFLIVAQISLRDASTLNVINGIVLIPSVIVALVLCLQFDLNRNTKYDRMRIARVK